VSAMLHLLIILDGGRRYAKREFLADAVRSGSLAEALKHLSTQDAASLRKRIDEYVTNGCEVAPPGPDLLDCIAPPPRSYLDASYRKSSELIDTIVRWVLSETQVGVLTIYGSQPGNYMRTTPEVQAFLAAEGDRAAAWAQDQEICGRCRFSVVGDTEFLDEQRHAKPDLAPLIDRFKAVCREVTERANGNQLRINVLSPYDFRWEMRQATRNGLFDPSALAVPDNVDCIVRTGWASGRRTTSGAMPWQTAFSAFVPIEKYPPECTIDDVRRALRLMDISTRLSGA